MGTCSSKRKTIKCLNFGSLNLGSAIQEPCSPTFVFSKMYDRTFQFNNVDEIVQPSNHKDDDYLKHYKQIKTIENVNLRRNQIMVQHIFTRKHYIAELHDINEQTTQYVDIVSNLSHSCLQDVIEIYQHNNQYVLILDYCNGGNIQYIRQKLQFELTNQQKQFIMQQIFDVMSYLHQQSFVHGCLTLKCFEKVDQSNSYAIKLTDLGQLLNNKLSYTQNHLKYFSPQRAVAYQKQLDISLKMEDDIWGIGIIAAQIVFNKYLISGSSTSEIIKNISEGRIQELPERSDCFHQQFKILLDKMLQSEEDQRISLKSASEQYCIQSTNIGDSQQECQDLQILSQTLAYMMAELFPDNFLNYLDQLKKAKRITRFQLNTVLRKHLRHIFNTSESLHLVNNLLSQKLELSYIELINKLTDKRALITQSKLEVAFRRFCSTKRLITIDDILPFFPEKEKDLEKGFNQFPGSAINQEQFKQLMFNYLLRN